MEYMNYDISYYDNDYYYSQYEDQKFEKMVDSFFLEKEKAIKSMYSYNN